MAFLSNLLNLKLQVIGICNRNMYTSENLPVLIRIHRTRILRERPVTFVVAISDLLSLDRVLKTMVFGAIQNVKRRSSLVFFVVPCFLHSYTKIQSTHEIIETFWVVDYFEDIEYHRRRTNDWFTIKSHRRRTTRLVWRYTIPLT